MGKRRMFDEDVHEVFREFGVEVAIFFEAVRYRQQLDKDHFFPFKIADIKSSTGLTYRQQLRARRVLESTGWIITKRGLGSIVYYKVTDLAKKLIKHTPRKRSRAEMAQIRVKRFSKKYNKVAPRSGLFPRLQG